MEQRGGADSSMINIAGAVDKFVPPRTLSGWVRDNTDLTRSAEILVSVYRGDRLLAQGRPTSVRPSLGDVLTNFTVECCEPIADEAVAFEMLRIEALDCYGRPHPIAIWDVVRAECLKRLLAVVPAPGMYWARTVLSFLGNCMNVPPAAREALLKLHDLYFEEDSRALMFTFESLGCDCALGGLQRAFGAEPLSLFRFCGVGIDAILIAMRDRFKGIGDPEFTRLVVQGDAREYFINDTRYGMSSHTFVYEGDVDYDDFYQKQCKKLKFLVRNILEKLKEERKIFVVHRIPEAVPAEKLIALQGLIQSYGAGRLLYLEAANDVCPPGTFMMRDDGIMQGYVLPYQDGPGALVAETRQSWLRVLQKAEAAIFEK